MGMVLNSKGQLRQWTMQYQDKYFVDKSEILEKLNQCINTGNRFVCITRPRRFGKTVMTQLIASYYGKGLESKKIFDTLKISKNEKYEEHLNKHNVISLYMSDTPFECNGYKDYIRFHCEQIKEDLIEAFPECKIKKEQDVFQVLKKVYNETGETFIFIIDEWDSFFHASFFSEKDGENYLSFLRNLLKDKPYVDLAYMTGILPIKKYSSGSELNMFDEFYFPTDTVYDRYFGFLEEEVKELCERNQKSGGNIYYEDLAEWYNGYYTSTGAKLYNPRSINKALSQNTMKDYWTETGPGAEIITLIQKNEEVKEDVLKLVAGEKIPMLSDDFTAALYKMETKEEIFSAMIIYGFLSYYDGYVTIPNREIMKKFQKALADKRIGYIAELAKESEFMLEATLNKDTNKMEEILGFVHDTEIPILQYNDENSLACVVTLVYLNARDRYRVEREDKAGKGYADFIFYPNNPAATAIILELKKDDTPEKAIQQIKDKKYSLKLSKLQQGKVHTGRVLLVGMTYNTKNKEHRCLVEEI